jgi:inositol-phosphate phosphatase/L-galactose 1-phosphate phosphatase/histidinol-phosphatase
MEDFVEVGHKLADAARTIIIKYWRSGFQIIDKEDLIIMGGD